MSSPSVSQVYGLAPEEPVVTPVAAAFGSGGFEPIRWPLRLDGPVTLDFGRKLTGRVELEIDGPVEYAYASDPEQLERMLRHAGKAGSSYDIAPSYIRGRPVGRTAPGAPGRPTPLDGELAALRLLRLEPAGKVTLRAVRLRFSPPHLPLAGRFTCDDGELNRFWHFGVYTTLLCTQSNMDAMVPVLAPGKGYVIWDGARRDREVWAGDLRVAGLIWLNAYADPEPVRNSLYMLWQTRHVMCSESGMIAASGSTHQTFYSYAFWFMVNAWEYYLHTADRDFLTALLAPTGLDWTLEWVKRKANRNGLLEAAEGLANSWMYVYELRGELAELAMAQVAGLEAMACLFDAGGRSSQAAAARDMAGRVRRIIPARFYDPQAGAFRMRAMDAAGPVHYPLDANVLGPILGIGDASVRRSCLAFLKSAGLQAPTGLRCLWPPFDQKDGDWAKRFPAWHWVHNTTVWPYPNGYAAWAFMLAGDMRSGIELLKAFQRPIDARGHCTIWEAMMPGGGLPIGPDGNTLSFAHAWGGLGSFLMQRQVLGIAPLSPGFARMTLRPDLGPLAYAAGTVPTPHGPIEVTLERKGGALRGQLRLPAGVEAADVPPGIEITSNQRL
jgi:hypothetical protein